MKETEVMSADDGPRPVLDFWFSAAAEPQWFFGGSDFDAEIHKRFARTLAQAATGALDYWCEGGRRWEPPEGRLALVLVLDQFSRNIHRGRPAAFAWDPKALGLARQGLRRGDDLWLKTHRPDSWRTFFYMPLMHSEDLEDQRRCIDLLLTHGPEDGVAYARAHHDIIARFGRFPHRNAVLNRRATPDEDVFLTREGSRFDS